MCERMIVFFLSVVCVLSCVSGQESVCPEILEFDTNNTETDRWYANITIQPPGQTVGVWIEILLDSKAQLLGSEFSNVVTEDNIKYRMSDWDYIFKPNEPLIVRIFARYLQSDMMPNIAIIRLNGKLICPAAPITESNPINKIINVYGNVTINKVEIF